MKNVEWTHLTPATAKFSTEASTIGLRPGEWPHHLDTALGNGQPLIRQYREGDGYLYRQRGSDFQVYVIND